MRVDLNTFNEFGSRLQALQYCTAEYKHHSLPSTPETMRCKIRLRIKNSFQPLELFQPAFSSGQASLELT